MKKDIKILHIDDSYLDRSLVKDILNQESSDFILFEADTREKFESLISEQEFDKPQILRITFAFFKFGIIER